MIRAVPRMSFFFALASAAPAVVGAQTIDDFVYRGATAMAELGAALDAGADVNGDGVPDVVVGEPTNSDGKRAGRVRVLSGKDGVELYRFEGVSPDDEFGRSVAFAGDVDLDGVPDVVAGAPRGGSFADFGSGSVRVFSGEDGATLHHITGLGSGPTAAVGAAVDGAGDVNADGYADLVIGAPGHDVPASNAGGVFVVSGKSGTLLQSLQFALNSDELGAAVSGAGDLDNDGFDDILVAAPNDNAGIFAQGSVWALSAGQSYAQIHHFTGTTQSTRFGEGLDGGRDFDGDGVPDVLVGAPFAPTQNVPGQAFVLSGASGQMLLSKFGFSAGDRFGASVSFAHDVNGDTREDVLIGAPGQAAPSAGSGAAYVYSGATQTLIHTLSGLAFDAAFGSAVAGVGDIDGDGRADLAVAAPKESSPSPMNGTLRVFSGQSGLNGGQTAPPPGGSAPNEGRLVFGLRGDSAGDHYGFAVAMPGDVDGDGNEDVLVGSPLDDDLTDGGSVQVLSGVDGAVLYEFRGVSPDDAYGFAVDGAGDLDGDGFLDVVVGAPLGGGFASASPAGSARVHSGADGTTLHHLFGLGTADAQFGFAVSGAGDVNGDGHDDVIVGAPFDDQAGQDFGSAWILSGVDGAVLQTVTSAAARELGRSVDGGGDFDGDGFADTVIGSPLAVGLLNPNAAGMAIAVSGQDFSRTVFQGVVAATPWNFGASVAVAGDVDGDGRDEIIVGAPASQSDPQAGMAWLLSVDDAQVVRLLFGAELGGEFGVAVAGAGDVDGDGRDDVIVGARFEGAGSPGPGVARVYSGATGQPVLSVPGAVASDETGISVAGGGDLDGDGRSEVIVGAPFHSAGAPASGLALVASGQVGVDGPTFVPVPLPPLADDGVLLRPWAEGNPGDRFGSAVAFLGDVDDDSEADVLVGIPFDDTLGADIGRIRIYRGTNGKELQSVKGDEDDRQFGAAVAAAGDIDADGKVDFLVGAPLSINDADLDAGSVTLFLGKGKKRRVTGSSLDRLGCAVAGIGDVDLDGFDDFAAGAPGGGYVRVYFGEAKAKLEGIQDIPFGQPSTGFGEALAGGLDVDGDGHSDFVIGARAAADVVGTSSGLARVISGQDFSTIRDYVGSSSEWSFGGAVALVTDVDGDDRAEVLVGAPHDAGANGAGAAWLYSTAVDHPLRVLFGDALQDQFGDNVVAAGDLDGDGFGDFAISAPRAAGEGVSKAGLVRAFSGKTGVVLHNLLGKAADDRFGLALAGGGDADRDGVPDLAVGVPFADAPNANTGAVRLYTGMPAPEVDKFVPGALIAGDIDAVDDIDEVCFDGLDGMRIDLEVWVVEGNLEPRLRVLDPDGELVATKKFPGSSAQGWKVKLEKDGPYRLVVESGAGTGSYRIATARKLPSKAKTKKLTKKIKQPTDFEVQAFADATLTMKLKPKGNTQVELLVTLESPSAAQVDLLPFASLDDGVLLIEQVPLPELGTYRMVVTPGANGKGKWKVTLGPQQPPHGEDLVSID